MEFIDYGIIIKLSRESKSEYKINILLKDNGHYLGFYNLYKHNLVLGSIGKVVIKVRAKHAKIRFYQAEPSISIYIWDNPILMTTFASVCESASRFVPECIPNSDDYYIFRESLALLKKGDHIDALINWERHLLDSYLDQSKLTDRPETIDSHVARTPQLNTRSRLDLLEMVKLVSK